MEGSMWHHTGKMSVCVQLFVSLLVNKRVETCYRPLLYYTACLVPLAIFSHRPCQGPHIHPPTVGSSSLRYNGPWQTTVINPCRLFIQPMQNTCSPLMQPAASHMSKTHKPGNVVGYLVGSRDYRMAPKGSPAWLDSGSCSHASPKSFLKANQHLCLYLPLFILTRDCNQSNGFKATFQIHAQILRCPQSCSCSQIIMINYYSNLF